LLLPGAMLAVLLLLLLLLLLQLLGCQRLCRHWL
jgi:hypothetical protein